MAVAKLGMIITDIAGSIGGTTLKRQSGNIAVYNKSRGPNKSILYQNKGLGRMNNARAVWRNYDNTQKEGWDSKASDFTFPDKFGVPRNITGYQLFTKSSNALDIISESVINSSAYNQNISNFTINDFEMDYETHLVKVTITSTVMAQYYLYSFDVNCKEGSKPIFNNREILSYNYFAFYGEMFLDTAFWSKFPWVQIGQNVRVYVTPMNVAGYKGVTQYADFIVR